MIPGLRRADAPAIQAVLETDPDTWQLLEGKPLRPDEAHHLMAELPPGVTPDRKHLWVSDDVVIDMVEGYPDAQTWYLGLIFIAPAARNAGLGARVIDAVCNEVRARGGTRLRLAVVAENVAARRLYDRIGFQFVDRRQRGAQQVDVMDRHLG